ncbi:MAG: hypothetical protein CVU73_01975 [Deltaproteobacteria bacterium HGW-Deltaproteobacteria-8]|jgi:hypothetical protein|nr:MAG: hypothetical protein CVU73_01975 [Deltaproteobacteria bacterium HGW-Deltaproteobacteria-8]
MMRILCPMCGFGREIDLAKIPPRAQMATCPRCQHKFRFRVVDDLPPADPRAADRSPAAPRPAPSSPLLGGQDLSARPGPASGRDPLAAQRAAAEQAWKHLQGVKPEGPKPDPAPQATAQEPSQPSPEPTSAPFRPEPTPESGLVSAGSPVPFEDLPRHGFFPGLWRTITAVLKTPSAFFRSMPVSGGMAKPLIFHLLLAEFMMVSQYFWGLSSLASLSQYTGSQELMDLGMGMAGTGPILLLVFYPLLLILRLMLMTGIIHLLLRAIFRFTGGPGSGAEATFRVLCYSAAPLLMGVVPFFGPLMGGVWSLVLTVIGLKEAHRTSVSAAMFAVFLPILLLLAAALGLMQAGVKG